MPDSTGIQPPYLDPSQYPDYQDMQRKQMLAQMLMQNSQQALQTPQNWDSMKIVPRKSALSSISGLLGSYLAGKANTNAMQAQSKYFQGMYAPEQSAPAQPSASPPTPPPPLLKAPAGDEYQPPVAPTVSPQKSPMIPQGMSKQTAQMLINGLGIEGYTKNVLVPNAMGTTEWQNALRAAGGDQQKATSMLRMAAMKNGSLDVRPGGTVGAFDDQGNFKPGFTAPQNGIATNWGINGPTQSTMPGATESSAAMTAAETAAKVANTPQEFKTQGGGSTVGYPGDVLGAPPAMRPPSAVGTPAQSAHPGPRYFPSLTSSSHAAAPDRFPDAPKSPTYSGIGAPGTQDETMQKARAEHQVALYQKYGSESDLADATLTRINEAQKALEGSNAGPLSSEMTKVQGILHQVAPSIFAGQAATNTQVANKNMVQIALNGAKGIYGPRMTSSEVMLQKNEASPSTEQTREAAKYLLQQQAIIAQYQKQRSSDYQDYIQAGHDPLRFEGWYSNNPKTSLQAFALRHDSARQEQLAKDRGINVPAAAFERLTQRPELKEDFRKQFGYIPDGY